LSVYIGIFEAYQQLDNLNYLRVSIGLLKLYVQTIIQAHQRQY